MAETICGGKVDSESEFQGGLTATCGPNAASAAARWADQSNEPRTLDVYRKMRALGKGDAQGASTISALKETLNAIGYHLATPLPGEAIQTFVTRLAGTLPVVLEVANGHVFRDYLSGQSEDARHLEYHYVTVFGHNAGGISPHANRTLPRGYWVADGDSNAQNLVHGVRDHRGLNRDLCFYPEAMLEAARPYGAFAVLPRVVIPGGPSTNDPAATTTPVGWNDEGKTLVAPNGIVVVLGFRDFVLAHDWDANNWPLAPEFHADQIEPGNPAMGGGSRQDFRLASLGCQQYADDRWGTPYRIWVGRDILALRAQIAALQQQGGPGADDALPQPPDAAQGV